MKILVIGCGSIGRRHIRLLKEMGVEVGAYDIDSNARDAVMRDLTLNVYQGELSVILGCGWDGAIIATPNHLHTDPAIACIVRGIPILIEKPIAHTVAAAQRILWTNAGGECGDGPDVSVLVGYCLRYHPGLRRLKQMLDDGTIGTVRHASIHFGSYLPDWRPGTDYRQNYAASSQTGGGILMDASHELDYARWLFGEVESVSCVTQNTGALEIDAEDVADLTLRFKSGVQANVHLDYLNQWPTRHCEVIGDKTTAYWDFNTDFVWLRRLTAQANPVVADDLYRAQLKHFLAVIQGKATSLVTAEDGLKALQLVEAAKRSAVEGRVVAL